MTAISRVPKVPRAGRRGKVRGVAALGVVTLVSSALMGVAAIPAQATPYTVCTWSSSSSTDVNDPANYTTTSGDCSALAGAQLVFPATVPGSGADLSLTANLSVDDVVLDNSYTLGGSGYTLTVSGSANDVTGIVATSGTSTIAANLATPGTNIEASSGASLEVSGTVSASSWLDINDNGTGTVVLSADNTASLTAPIFVYGGTLEVANSGALGLGGINVYNYGTLALDAGVTVPAGERLYGLVGTLETVGSGTATWAGPVGLGFNTDETVTLAAPTGSVLELSGTVRTAGIRTAVTVGRSGGWDGTVKLSGGASPYGNENFWGGVTTVAYGTLQDGTNDAVSSQYPLDVQSGATLDLNGYNQSVTSLTGDGTGTFTDTAGGGTLTFFAMSSSYTVTEAITGGLNVAVHTNGSTITITLSPGNSYTGSTTTYGFGAMVVTDSSELGDTSGITVGGGSYDGTLVLDGSISLSAPIAIPRGVLKLIGTGASATLTGPVTAGASYTSGTIAAAAGDSVDVQGAVTGTSLIVGATGLSGTVTMSNSANTVSSTKVAAGTLGLSGALSGNVTIDAAATLEGSGTVGSISAYGTLIAGGAASPGILHSDFTWLGSGSSLGIYLAGDTPGTGYSQLVASGGVNLYGNLELTVDPSYTAAPGTTFDVATFPWRVDTAFANAPEGAILTAGGQSFQVHYTDTVVELTAVAAPGAPTNVVAAVTKSGKGKTTTHSVTLNWSAPDNGGAAISDYYVNVYSYSKKGGYTLVTSSPIDTGSTSTSFTIPSDVFPSSGVYAFTVAAANSIGTGAESDYSNTIKY